ncbi:MAG TPA: PrsW family glutamic-type intramembrane protease [Candidatus Paceibacterota bacterium]|nr:PrsW family glutamic-type intramembrane protease [Candidatus Paceibacterota bacterium]
MDSAVSYLLLVGLGSLPSIIWLSWWLKKDCHPEPKVLITKTLLMGIILSPLAIIFQLIFAQYVLHTSDGPVFYLWASFVEELVKYGAVALIALRSPDMDEPVDMMIYMLTAALGFAAMENILVINRVLPDGVTATVGIWGLRFAGATLLHVLSSAIFGYFIALSWFWHERRNQLFAIGLVFATVVHWVFNLFISSASESVSLGFSTALLIAMGFMVSALFDKIKERQSTRSARIA